MDPISERLNECTNVELKLLREKLAKRRHRNNFILIPFLAVSTLNLIYQFWNGFT